MWLRVDYGCRRLQKPTSPLIASSRSTRRCSTEHREVFQSSRVSLHRFSSEFRRYRKPRKSVQSLSSGLYGCPQHGSGKNACPGTLRLARVHSVIPPADVQALCLLTFCHVYDKNLSTAPVYLPSDGRSCMALLSPALHDIQSLSCFSTGRPVAASRLCSYASTLLPPCRVFWYPFFRCRTH